MNKENNIDALNKMYGWHTLEPLQLEPIPLEQVALEQAPLEQVALEQPTLEQAPLEQVALEQPTPTLGNLSCLGSIRIVKKTKKRYYKATKKQH